MSERPCHGGTNGWLFRVRESLDRTGQDSYRFALFSKAPMSERSDGEIVIIKSPTQWRTDVESWRKPPYADAGGDPHGREGSLEAVVSAQ